MKISYCFYRYRVLVPFLNGTVLLAVFVGIFFAGISSLQAQQTLTLHENLVTNEVPSLWNISLATNTPKEYEEIQLKLSLADANDKTIYEVLSPDILLSTRKIKTLNPSLGIAQTLVNELNGSTLPDGRYEVSYRENKSNHLLKQRQFTVNGTNISFAAQADTGKIDIKKWINTTGTARITSAFSNPQGLQSEQKPYYSRLEANPTVILGGVIPISANVLLSTEQNPNGLPMAQASLNFDCNYARALLEQKAMAKIESMKPEELDKMAALKEKFMDKKMRHLAECKEKLASPEAAQQLAQAEAYQRVAEQKAKLEAAIDPKRLEALTEQYHIGSLEELEARQDAIPEKEVAEMMYLMASASAYEEAKAQLDQLQSAKAQAEKLMAQKEKLEQLEGSSYLQMLRDPRFSRKVLKGLGVSNPGTQFIGGIKSLGMGTTYPLYTPFTMSGTRVNGLNVEWNPAILYMAFTRGSVGVQRFDSIANRHEFERKLLAARLGIGKKTGTHLIMSYIRVADQGLSFVSPQDSQVFNPSDNLVVGTDMQLTLFKKRFMTQLEIDASATTTDTSALEIPFQGTDYAGIMGQLAQLRFEPNASTRFDAAILAKTELHLFKDNTVISGQGSYVGANYVSYGVPFLMNDQLKYEGKLTQSAWKKRISVGGFYKYYTDNAMQLLLHYVKQFEPLPLELPPAKSFTTTLQGFGAEMTLNIPKLPSVWAKYLPVSQGSNMNLAPGQAQVPLLASAMTLGGLSYNYKILKLSFNTQIQLSRYTVENNVAISNLQMNSAMLMQTIAFSNGMNCTATGFYNQASGQGIADQMGMSLSGTALLKKKVMTGLEVHTLAQGRVDSKTGLTFNANYRIMKNLSAQLRVTVNRIQSQTFGDRGESFGSLVLSVNW